jgi:hypothetical protein
MLEFDQKRVEALAKIFSAQELDFIVDRFSPGDALDPNQIRVMDIFYAALDKNLELS